MDRNSWLEEHRRLLILLIKQKQDKKEIIKKIREIQKQLNILDEVLLK